MARAEFLHHQIAQQEKGPSIQIAAPSTASSTAFQFPTVPKSKPAPSQASPVPIFSSSSAPSIISPPSPLPAATPPFAPG